MSPVKINHGKPLETSSDSRPGHPEDTCGYHPREKRRGAGDSRQAHTSPAISVRFGHEVPSFESKRQGTVGRWSQSLETKVISADRGISNWKSASDAKFSDDIDADLACGTYYTRQGKNQLGPESTAGRPQEPQSPLLVTSPPDQHFGHLLNSAVPWSRGDPDGEQRHLGVHMISRGCLRSGKRYSIRNY